VPIVVNRLLALRVGTLLKTHPGLVVELIPESRDLSLTHREADIAVRLARPSAGGISVKARRIGAFTFVAYAAAGCGDEMDRLPWISYEDAMAHLPQARWIARTSRTHGTGAVSRLRVRDAETALEAVAAGVGKTLLPTVVADRDARLMRVPLMESPGWPSREVWLLAHTDQVEHRRVTAAMAWIRQELASSPDA
jgi:DNA-binding transcriptional LysR family regulator